MVSKPLLSFEEFSEFISEHVTTTAEIIIVGDLNLHLDINTNPHTRQFTNLLACSGLKQHVNEPTHILGHTLDILITRDTSDVVCNVEVVDIGLSDNDGNVIRDHYAITCFITQPSPATTRKTVLYRKLKSINVDSFRNDIQASSSLNDSSGTLDEITTRYVSALNDLVDKHAPLLQRTITVRPHARWYNEQLRDAKHVRRQLERKWRHSKTESDHEAYRKQCSIVAKELYTAKTEFYSNKIIENQGDYKALFNIANTLLVNQNCATMPSSDDDSVLAELFSNFFVEKISKLRVNFTFDSSSGLDIAPLNNSFALVVPMIKLKHYGERSFSYAAPVEWNKLDVEIRSLSNLETFKKKVKTYLFNIAFT